MISLWLDCSRKLKGKLKGKLQQKHFNCLVDNLENQFSDSAVLGAFETLFNSKKASSASIEEYRNVAIDKIAAQYPTTVV